ncbi:hypothetical protein DL93DRAFT_2077190 [Clavulina sp. PMI_390]|nr:hypothetical protein DL93DRAFT_2077190 [Clavulina sp. PMI_390]
MSSRSTTSRRSGRSQPAAPNLDADFPPLHPSTQPPSKAKLPIKINDLIVGPLGRPDAPTSRRRTRPDTPSTQPSSAFQPSKVRHSSMPANLY